MKNIGNLMLCLHVTYLPSRFAVLRSDGCDVRLTVMYWDGLTCLSLSTLSIVRMFHESSLAILMLCARN